MNTAAALNLVVLAGLTVAGLLAFSVMKNLNRRLATLEKQVREVGLDPRKRLLADGRTVLSDEGQQRLIAGSDLPSEENPFYMRDGQMFMRFDSIEIDNASHHGGVRVVYRWHGVTVALTESVDGPRLSEPLIVDEFLGELKVEMCA